MAKKSSTIHVENFVWDEIENIQNEQGISSRNTAIEYLVAEYRGLKSNINTTNSEVVTSIKSKDIEQKPTDKFADRLRQMEEDMED